MYRKLFAATAAVLLVAGCSDADNPEPQAENGTESPASASASPTASPDLPSFDPPKAFSAVAAIAEPRTDDSTLLDGVKAGIVGKTSLYANLTAITGRWVDGGRSWQVLAKDVPTTKTNDLTGPMAVQLDGKEVIATAYGQRVEAGGTQKAHSQVNFQWIDPDDGKVLVTFAADLTPVIGPGSSSGRIGSHAYDPATGQLVVTLGVSAPNGTEKVRDVTVFADPKTKKSTVIPGVRAAGVLNGTVVGAKGEEGEGSKSLSIVELDGAAGTVKKTSALPAVNYLSPVGTGGQHAFLLGSAYVKDGQYDGHYAASFYGVDLATGAIVENKLPKSESNDNSEFRCFSDHLTATVCDSTNRRNDAIIAFDDKTGQKIWGYTSQSASRVVPVVTAVYNGAVYGQAETLPAVLDARTGQDLPAPAATPGASPTDSGTPTEASTPTNGTTPSDSGSPSTGSDSSSNVGGWGDTSLIYGPPKSPEMVSKYGSTYLLENGKAPLGTEKILVVQKAIG